MRKLLLVFSVLAWLLGVALMALSSGCGHMLPDSVWKARKDFCSYESCPAAQVVHPWLKLMWGVYDAEQDACSCVMKSDSGRDVVLVIPRDAPADSEVVK